MIRFLIANKFKFYLKGLKSFPNLLIYLLLVLTAWFYGRMLGLISEEILAEEIDGISFETLETIVFLVICLITLLRSVFPSYVPLQQLFPRYYPLSNLERYGVSLINDFLKPYFFYLSIFIFSGSFYLPSQNLEFFANGFFILIGSHLIRRSIQYVIDFRLKVIGLFSLIPAVFVPILLLGNINTLVILIAVSFLSIIGFMQERAILEARQISLNLKTDSKLTILSLLLNNKNAMVSILVALGFKTLFLLLNLVAYKIEGRSVLDDGYIYWIIATPLLHFSYAFNNIWGYWKSLWLNLYTRNGQYQLFVLHSLKLLAFPIIIDLAITFPFLFFSGSNLVFVVVFYLTSTIFLVSFSLLASLVLPLKVYSIIHFKATTSFPAGLFSGLLVICLISIKVNIWFYLLIPLFLILSGVAIWASFAFFKESRYKVTSKLLK